MALGMGMGAVSLGSIFVAINANLTGLVSGTHLAKAKLGHFQRQVATVSPQLQRLGMTATVAGGAIVAMAALSVRAFAQFEQEMANVGSVLGQHFKDMGMMSDIAREWGQTTIFSARETGQAMYYLASAGYNAEQTVEALGATLTLAGATMNDLSQTTQMVVAAMNAFALGTENADRVANAYAAAISKSQATAARLAISMRYVAPIAHNAGQKFEGVVAALGLLYNSGMEASMAGTALRMSLVRLSRLTPMARKEIENLGIAVQDIDPTMHSLVEIIREFEEHRITPRAASVIFGARALAGVLNLVTAGADRLDQMTQSITDTNKAYDMLDIQTDTFLKTLTMLKNAITEVIIQFGEGLVPVLREVAEGARSVAIRFGDMNPVLKHVMSAVAATGGLSLLLAGILALLASVLPKLVIGFKAIGAALGLLTGPFGVLIALGAALVGVFWKVGRATREANKDMLDTIDADREAIKTGAAKIAKLQELTKTYDKLSEKENKTTAEMRHLQQVMEDIKDLQPSLVTGLDEFGKVIDLDRERVSAYTDELIRHHNTQRLLHKASWEERMSQLDEQREAEAEIVNDYLDQIKTKGDGLEDEQRDWEKNAAAYDEFHRQKSEAVLSGLETTEEAVRSEVDLYGQAISGMEDLADQIPKIKGEPAILAEPEPAHPGKSPADEMKKLEAAGQAAEDQLHATNLAWAILNDAVRALDPSGLEDVALGVSGEQILNIVKDQEKAEDRIQALKLGNLNERFDEEAEEARRANAEETALADALAAHRKSLEDKVTNYRRVMAQETDDEKKEAIQKSMDRELGTIGELMVQEEILRTQSAQRLDQALTDIEKRRDEQKLTDAKAYLDRLKALRIAAQVGDYAQARASVKAQYAEDLELAKEAGEYKTEIEVLAALVLKQKLAKIRENELLEELEAERSKHRMSLSEYNDYLIERLSLAEEDGEDYLALQAEIAEIEAEINERRQQDWERFGNSIANSLSNATVNWLNALRRDAKEAEQIWTDLGQHIKDQIIKKALDPLTAALTQAIAVMLEEIGKLIYRLLFAKALAWMLNLFPGGGAGAGAVAPTSGYAEYPIIPPAQKGGAVVRGGVAKIHHDERVLSPRLTDLVESMAEAPFPGAGFGRGTSPAELATAARAAAAPRAPWTEMGMSAADFFALAAIEHVDPIIVAPGAMLSIDEDSVDDFLEKTLIPAKRRYAQRLRDVVGEVID